MGELGAGESLPRTWTVKEVAERVRQRSLYRLVWCDKSEDSEYSDLEDQNDSLGHGELAICTRRADRDCRWYPEYPSRSDFGKDATGSPRIVLQALYDPYIFDIYKSGEGLFRFSQKPDGEVRAIIHTSRMNRRERRVSRKRLKESKEVKP